MARIQSDPNVAAIGALIGDPSRAAILMALADGRALPAGELARYAGISPQTASAHLDRLFRGKLIAVEIQGRHHYYRLHDERVARVIEELAVIAPSAPAFAPDQRRQVQILLNRRGRRLRIARTCYGHLAGKLGVAVTQGLCRAGFLIEEDCAYRVSASGHQWFGRIGVDIDALRHGGGRPLTRRCLDWSERRHHLSGALGVAIARRFFALDWIVRVRESRALRLTDRGRSALRCELGVILEPESNPATNHNTNSVVARET